MIKLVILAILSIGLMVGQMECHPTRYTRAVADQLSDYIDNGNSTYPKILSWHIHVLFINKKDFLINQSLALRNRFIQHFKLQNVKECDTLVGHVSDNRFCMFPPEIYPDLISPFVSGNWAAMIPLNWFLPTVTWISQNRGEFDVFIHPNTADLISDHLDWSFKAGQVWPLNLFKRSSPPIW